MDQHLAGSGWLQYNTAWSGIHFEELETCSNYSCTWSGQVCDEWLTGWESLRTKFLISPPRVEWFQSAVLMLRERTRSYSILNWARMMFWGPESEKCWTEKPSPKRKPPPKLGGCPNLISPSPKEMVLPASSLALLALWCCRTGAGFAVGRGGDNGAAVINTQLQGRGGRK